MSFPTIDVDSETFQLFENYISEWTHFLDQKLNDYNISPHFTDKPEWFCNLEFSYSQRKCAFEFLLLGMRVTSSSINDDKK